VHQLKFYNHSLSSKGNQGKSKDLKLQTLTLPNQMFIAKTSKPHIFFIFFAHFEQSSWWRVHQLEVHNASFKSTGNPFLRTLSFQTLACLPYPTMIILMANFIFLWLFLNLKNMFSKCKMGFSTHKKNHHFCEIELFLKGKQSAQVEPCLQINITHP